MVRVFVISSVLIEVDAGKSCESERASISAEFHVVIHLQITERRQRRCEFLHGGNQLVMTTDLEASHCALSSIENQRRDVIGHFALMRLHVGERTEQSFFFAGEEHEANGAARFES